MTIQRQKISLILLGGFCFFLAFLWIFMSRYLPRFFLFLDANFWPKIVSGIALDIFVIGILFVLLGLIARLINYLFNVSKNIRKR